MFCLKNKKNIRGLSILLVALIVFIPTAETLAQSQPPRAVPLSETGESGETTTAVNSSTEFIGSTAMCSAGQILARVLTSTVGGIIGSITNTGKSKVVGAIEGQANILRVPTSNYPLEEMNARYVSARVGGGVYPGFASAALSGVTDVSWDSIAYCIANEMIRYIGQSTIQWIQSGFEGNPVFIDNTQSFFKGLADQEAATFIQQIVGDTTGINVCEPFRVQLAVDTLGTYGYGNYRHPLSCSLSTIKNNFEQFAGGDWYSGGFPGWFELIQMPNNPYGARILANQELLDRISVQQNTARIELDWASGYRSFKVCGTEEDANGNCKSRPDGTSGLVTTTLGGYIESTVNARGAMPGHRLELAQTFDQIVSALVNELIKIAVTDLFTGNNSGYQSQTSSYYSDLQNQYNDLQSSRSNNINQAGLTLNTITPPSSNIIANQGPNGDQYNELPTLVFDLSTGDRSLILDTAQTDFSVSGINPAKITTARLYDLQEILLASSTVSATQTPGLFTAIFSNINYPISGSAPGTFIVTVDIAQATDTQTLLQSSVYTSDIILKDANGSLLYLNTPYNSVVGNVLRITR